MGVHKNDLKFKSRRAKERNFNRLKEIKMFTNRLFILSIIAIFVITSCAPQVAATPNAGSPVEEPITLHLAVADEEGRPSDPYIHEFIDQVKKLSNGNIAIEPTWDAGSTTEAGFETGVIQLV